MQPFPWPSRQNWIKIRRPCHVLLPNCFSSRLRSAWSNQKVPRDIQCQPIQATLENVQSETRSSSEHATLDSWTIFVVVTCAQLAEISSCFVTCLPNDLIVTTNLRVLKKRQINLAISPASAPAGEERVSNLSKPITNRKRRRRFEESLQILDHDPGQQSRSGLVAAFRFRLGPRRIYSCITQKFASLKQIRSQLERLRGSRGVRGDPQLFGRTQSSSSQL